MNINLCLCIMHISLSKIIYSIFLKNLFQFNYQTALQIGFSALLFSFFLVNKLQFRFFTYNITNTGKISKQALMPFISLQFQVKFL